MSEMTINRKTAKRIYDLNDDDVKDLDCYENKYLVKEIRMIAIAKKYGINNPGLYEYVDGVQRILNGVLE